MKNLMKITTLSASLSTTRKALLARLEAVDDLLADVGIPKGIRVGRRLETTDKAEYSLMVDYSHTLHVWKDEGYRSFALAWSDVPARLIRPAADELPALIQDLISLLEGENTACAESLEKIMGK